MQASGGWVAMLQEERFGAIPIKTDFQLFKGMFGY